MKSFGKDLIQSDRCSSQDNAIKGCVHLQVNVKRNVGGYTRRIIIQAWNENEILSLVANGWSVAVSKIRKAQNSKHYLFLFLHGNLNKVNLKEAEYRSDQFGKRRGRVFREQESKYSKMRGIGTRTLLHHRMTEVYYNTLFIWCTTGIVQRLHI